MTVVDASVLVDALVVAGPLGDEARHVVRGQPVLAVPSIFTAEATSALRFMLQRHEINEPRARAALQQVRQVHTQSYPFEPFIDRVWALRDNLTVYDAWYVALAESLETELVTSDPRLADAPGPRCPIVALPGA